jgi:branched-chain amino acid aminotransferase
MNIKFVWMNGSFVGGAKASVPLLTHSLHYGSAVFEGIRFYETKNGPAVFRLEDHIKRLFYSAKVMGMNIPYSQKELCDAILTLIVKNKLTSGYIRPIVFYGSKMGLDPTGADVNVAIACWPWGKYLAKEVIKVKISKYIRIHPESSDMGAKISGHYANSILSTLEAKKAKYDEALLLDYKGNIAEGPGENIFFVKGNTVYLPSTNAILSGITRNTVMALARDLGYEVIEKDIKPRDIKKYDEAFFTGTAAEITAIGNIDGEIVGTGKEGLVTKNIRETYQRLVCGEYPRHKNWLSY